MPRLFVAIGLPEEYQSHLASSQAAIPGVRWVHPDNLHVTLRFLGDVDPSLVSPITDELGSTQSPSFVIHTVDVAVFPSHRRPRVLVVRLSRPRELMELAGAISEACGRVLGLAVDGRPFQPHVTLARFKSPAPSGLEDAMTVARSYLASVPEEFTAHSFTLYESILTLRGPIYRPLLVRNLF